jgi:hypothetical protein
MWHVWERGPYRALVVQPEEKTTLEIPKYKWENIIKINLEEIRWVWSGLIWLRVWRSGEFM